MKNLSLTTEELDNIHIALSMRKNYILTGDAMKDLDQAAREKMPAKNLSMEQMRLVVATDDLMQRVQKLQFSQPRQFSQYDR